MTPRITSDIEFYKPAFRCTVFPGQEQRGSTSVLVKGQNNTNFQDNGKATVLCFESFDSNLIHGKLNRAMLQYKRNLNLCK